MTELPTYEKSQKILNKMLKSIRFGAEAIYDMDVDKFYIDVGKATNHNGFSIVLGRLNTLENRLNDLGYRIHSIRIPPIKSELPDGLASDPDVLRITNIATLRILLTKR